ncbi:hypothetical protein PAMP_000923 [Pampus punctatissimus]
MCVGRCYEDTILTCSLPRLGLPNFIHRMANSSQEANDSPTEEHGVHIPSSALQISGGAVPQEEVVLVITVLNSTYFQQAKGQGRSLRPSPNAHKQHTVLGQSVLLVKAGTHPVRNLSQSIKLTFKYNKQVENGICVFWQESEVEDETGNWSTDGCHTSDNGTHFICSCNHLSFFAVLVNPALSVDKTNVVYLSYITYIGSSLSVFSAAISLIIYICLQRRRPEKAIGMHMQLAGALLCLHLSFLLSNFWVWQLNENEEDWICQVLGFFLHWSLLASISWMALEGFHLYLLLVRVFNIYVRRYLLKLSLVGWGLPTLIAVVCGVSGVYGKYSLELSDGNNRSSTAQICWMSSHFPQRLLVSYVTTVAFPSLVVLYNSCMLGLVMFKLWVLRAHEGWNKKDEMKWSRLWKDCATVLGLSCVLGLSWGVSMCRILTYSVCCVYMFAELTGFSFLLSGVFLFLWSMALTWKSQSDNSSSVRDSSSQKMITI